MSDSETVAFVKAHPPAGLKESGWSGSANGSLTMSTGLAWTGPDQDDASTAGELSVVVAAAGADASYFRVDAGQYWVDPRPDKFVVTGPLMRVEAGGDCPDNDRGITGVRSSGDALASMLAPSQTATGGLFCSYAGLNGSAFSLLNHHVLSTAEAVRAGRLAHAVELFHDGGLRNCPWDDGSAWLLVLDYPDRPAVDLWLRQRGCSWATNGVVTASGSSSLKALFDEATLLDQ